MRAAVAYDPGSRLVIEDLPIPQVGPRDVLVRVTASGICHTDVTSMRRTGRTEPLVPGHEACGIVDAVGAEVRRVKPGDRVLASVTPACGTCWWCVNEMSNHCDRGSLRFRPRLDLPDGRMAVALCGCGSFAEAMVVDESTVVAVTTDLPDEQLALLGCGVMTGLGAVFHTAGVRPGDSVAVIGCGGVGQAVVQGARIAGASTIIAIDLNAGRREGSLTVGATHALDPADGDPVARVRDLTSGRGVDHSFEVVGVPALMIQAFDMARMERVLRQRTTVLGILGSLAVGTAMFGSAVFLSQYFQLSRGYTATQAGLLSIPMVAGTLISSIGGGRLVSRTGKVKPFLITGAVLLATGFLGLGLIDARTPMVQVAAAMLLAGLGTGLTLQNFVLVVQNDTHLEDIGAASSTVTFFRSLGGTVGVAVLGAILARNVAGRIARDGHSAGVVRDAYGNATGLIFLVCAAVATLSIVAAVLLKPVTLRSAAASTDQPKEEVTTR
jgi:S-(hydroxymethyl)glutathione dehydrogenase/alcohol dehydrogenase